MDFQTSFEQLGVSLTLNGTREGVGLCPFHQDSRPSLSVNIDTGLWRCFACGASGNFEQFVSRLEGITHAKTIPEPVIETYQKNLSASAEALKWLGESRGLSADTISRYRLGLDGTRVCIPITEGGKYVNVRKHSMVPVKSCKTVSFGVGYGAVRLWPVDSLDVDVWICEGELDCLVLRQLGLCAVTTTGGAGSWKSAWDGLFAGKNVNIVYDTDKAGADGAAGVSASLSKIAKVVKVLTLPVKAGKDVTDYVVKEHATRSDFERLACSVVVKRPAPTPASCVVHTNLVEASHDNMVGKRVSLKAVAAGKDLAPYTVPKELEMSCEAGLKTCTFCPIHINGGTLKRTISPQDPSVLKLLNVTDDEQKSTLRRMCGIPQKCARYETKVLSYMNWEEIKGYPDLDTQRTGSSEYVVRTFYALGNGMRVNQSYEYEGVVMPHPDNQYVTFLFDKNKPLKDDLDNYVPSPAVLDRLKIFQTTDIMAKFKEIADDLSHNVTHIYQRNDLIYAYDVVAHSILAFNFQGKRLERGWVEGLVVGDTRCGKSETAKSLMRHYRMGELVTGENVSYAGLVGGMQQTQKRWSIIWGKLPMNDKRMLVLDEISGMSKEHIALMSGIRSSGIAEITKIQTERTNARVRQLWMSNSRNGQRLDSFANCAMIIEGLIGKKEDISRFDFCQMAGSDDVPVDVINSYRRAKYAHTYTSELCQELLLWAWSRTREQVIFTEAAIEACLHYARIFGDTYSSDLPLVERNEQRIKFARLGAAIAARTFSTEDGANLKVDSAHITAAADLLDSWYSNPNFNYHFYSETKNKELRLSADDIKAIKLVVLPRGFKFSRKLLTMEHLKVSDFEDIVGCQREEAKGIIHALIMSGALKRRYDNYVLTPAFITLLRQLKEADYSGIPEAAY